MCSFITLINDNHVDNYLKEIFAFVYYGFIVNSQHKKSNDPWVCFVFLIFFWTTILSYMYLRH